MKKEIYIDCSMFEHGGNIYRLAEELRIQERKIMDFSSSANPLGISKKIKAEIRKHLKYLHNYPDPEAKRLRKRLGQYYGIDPGSILCGNGSTELIYLITRALRPRHVLIPAPTYSEYERAVIKSQETGDESEITGRTKQRALDKELIKYLILRKENGFEIHLEEVVDAIKGIRDSSHFAPHSAYPCCMAFLCNPNNPTGKLLGRDDIIRIANVARETGCYLIVDEAFIEFCPGESVIKDVEGNPYLIVLRTLTNFYALSGLRIGYGVFPQHLIERLKKFKEPWTVNSLAQRAAVIALKDKAYKKESFKILKEEKRFLEKSFTKLGIDFFHSHTNFYLLNADNAHLICQHLMKKGILVRGCSNFKGLDNTYMRVSVRSHKENTFLIKEIASFVKQ